jgi:SAM-dependent methyltransferase
MTNVFAQFQALTDEEWIEKLVASSKNTVVDGVEFPGFPSVEAQSTIVGSGNEQALREAGNFYKFVKARYGPLQQPPIAMAKILDFGIGWGRYARMFARDVSYGQIYGVDVVPDMLEMCRHTKVPASLNHIEPRGSLPFRDELIDIAYAYSVFTHLPEDVCLHWIKELHRVIRPGGILIVTVEPRRFITFCRSISKSDEGLSAWHTYLRNVVAQDTEAEKRFDKGEFVYFPTGGGPQLPPDVYGDACIPPAYIKNYWSTYFKLSEYVDDPNRFWQAAVVLQRV